MRSLYNCNSDLYDTFLFCQIPILVALQDTIWCKYTYWTQYNLKYNLNNCHVWKQNKLQKSYIKTQIHLVESSWPLEKPTFLQFRIYIGLACFFPSEVHNPKILQMPCLFGIGCLTSGHNYGASPVQGSQSSSGRVASA